MNCELWIIAINKKKQKRQAVKAYQKLNFYIITFGDSYNDISIFQEADHEIFFRPTKKIAGEYPNFPVTHEFDVLKNELEQHKK